MWVKLINDEGLDLGEIRLRVPAEADESWRTGRLGLAVLWVGLLTLPWWGYVGARLWAWFVLPLHPLLPAIGWAWFCGLALVARFATYDSYARRKSMRKKDCVPAILCDLGVPAVALFFGWLYTRFM